VNAVLSGKFEVPSDSMRPDMTLDSLGLDSLAVIELLFILEQETGARIEDTEITPLNTVSELVTLAEGRRQLVEETPSA
jgi:acyl carrier protein